MYVAFKKFNDSDVIIGYDLQEAGYDSNNGFYGPVQGSAIMPLTSNSAIDYNFFDMAHQYPYTHHVPVPSDLNSSFINTNQGANSEMNVSDIKTTFSRDAGGNLKPGNGFVFVITVVVVEILTTDGISLSAKSAKDAGASFALTCITKVREKNITNNFLILFILIFNIPNDNKTY